jgi:hypothetical protein
MFHLSDPTHGVRAIKFVHLNSWKVHVTMKVIGMRTLEMGRVGLFMIGRLFKRVRVQGADHPLVKCVFDILDGETLFMEVLNGGIELDNVGINGLDIFLVLDVVGNQGIDFLGTGGFHLGRGKNGQAVPHRKKKVIGEGYHNR